VILALTHILMCGVPATLLVSRADRPSIPRLIGTSFLLGTGIVALVMLVVPSVAAVLAVTVLMWLLALRGRAFRIEPSYVDLATLILVLRHLVFSIGRRVGEWDFWAIWGLKGRVFFEHGGVDWRFLRDPYNAFAHPDYPPLVPLNYVFIAMHQGGWDDRWLGLMTTLFGVALVLVARELFARELPRHLAAGATVAVAGVALSGWIGTADAPMLAFGSAGLLLLRHRSTLPGALLLGFAACTKNEGLTLIVAAAVALVVARRGRDVMRLWPALVVAAPWQFLRLSHDLHGDLSTRLLNFGNALPLVRALLEFLPDRPLLWAGLALALLLFAREIARERFLLTAVLLQVAAYLGAYFVTPNEVRWHVQFSWARILDHVAVPLLFAVLILVGTRSANGPDDRDGNRDDGADHEERNDHGERDGHSGSGERDDHAHLHDEQNREDRQEQQFER
jgi:hypothetical protein